MSNPLMKVGQEIDKIVLSATDHDALEGFQRAFVVADAMSKLKNVLSPEYMAPIMELQGSPLGFKTDKKYNENIVKERLIEAVLMGLKPYGNQFNILGGNTYVTSEGLDCLLEGINGLRFMIKLGLPRMNKNGDGAAIDSTITWTYQGKQHEETINIPIRVNKGQIVDAVLGKAKRKSKKWLFETIKGIHIPDGEWGDPDFVELRPVSKSIADQQDQQAYQDCSEFISDAETIEQLEECEDEVDQHGLREMYNQKMQSLINPAPNAG